MHHAVRATPIVTRGLSMAPPLGVDGVASRGAVRVPATVQRGTPASPDLVLRRVGRGDPEAVGRINVDAVSGPAV